MCCIASYFDKKGSMNNSRLKTSLDGGQGNMKTSMNIIGFIKDDDGVLKADILLNKESTYAKEKLI
jgi:hypothetical protein